MNLQILWFVVIGFLLTGFFFLEGFDYGVGMLLPFLGKNDTERRMIMNSIGPFWDANEVWLIAAGGAMFAAFPGWYATMFSAFYPEMFLILFALILRSAAFEFRSQRESTRWHRFWESMICVGSILPGFFWGIILANLMHGMPIDAQGNYVGTILTPFNPFAILVGLAFDSFFLIHGASFLSLRVNGDMVTRARRVVTWAWFVNIVIVALVIITGFSMTSVFKLVIMNPRIVPLDYVVLAALILLAWFNARGHSGWSFTLSFVVIVGSGVILALCLFPNVMVSSLNPSWSLTVMNTATNPYSLTVLSWIGLSIVPFVVLYQAWNYWVFKKRVEAHAIGHY